MIDKPHERIRALKAKADEGPAFLQFAFRPFFLAAGLWAALSVPIWIATFAGTEILPGGIDAGFWHRHEMLFGFVAAAVTGFILTAIPNWTGGLPVSGWRLALLALFWLAGRVAMLASGVSGPWIAGLVDLAFPAVLILTIARKLISGKNWRNLPVLVLLSLFAIANALMHAEQVALADSGELGWRLAVYTVVLLVGLIGGRIVPSFTRNYLKKEGAAALPAAMDGFDKGAMALLVLFVLGAVFRPEQPATAALAVLTGLVHAVRLIRWRGYQALREPLVWVMHLGYGWLVLGILLTGAAGLSDAIPATVGLHAITVGGFGTMILAVMTRASLGHTGRGLSAGPGTTLIFLLISVAAIARSVSPILGEAETALLWIAATAWSAGFGLFVILYWPVLTGPKAGPAA